MKRHKRITTWPSFNSAIFTGQNKVDYFTNLVKSSAMSLENIQLATAEHSTICVFKSLSTRTTIIWNTTHIVLFLQSSTRYAPVLYINQVHKQGPVVVDSYQVHGKFKHNCWGLACWWVCHSSWIAFSITICASSLSANAFNTWWNLYKHECMMYILIAFICNSGQSMWLHS